MIKSHWRKIMQPPDIDKKKAFIRPFWEQYCKKAGIDPDPIEWKLANDRIDPRKSKEETK